MSHRRKRSSNLILPGGDALPLQPPRPANMQARPQAPAPPLEALVPYLMSRGVQPQLELGWETEGAGALTVRARCGPLTIPLGFDAPTSILVGKALVVALFAAFGAELVAAALATWEAAAAEAQAVAAELPPVPAGCEDLLAEAQAHVAGDDSIEPARRIIVAP